MYKFDLQTLMVMCVCVCVRSAGGCGGAQSCSRATQRSFGGEGEGDGQEGAVCPRGGDPQNSSLARGKVSLFLVFDDCAHQHGHNGVEIIQH